MPTLSHIGEGPAFPVQFDERTGGLQTSDLQARIEQSMVQILSTRPGERLLRPDFGCRLRELVFEGNTDVLVRLATYHVREAITRWEKRVIVENVTATPDSTGHELEISIQYRTTNGQVRGNLVYPFYREPSV